jgi:amino acid adenylation domain-containing protein
MMAVFLSGGVLLPIDNSLPRQRQQLILQEASAKFLLYIRGRGFEDAWWEQDSTFGVQSLEVDTQGLVRADTDFDLDAVSLPELGIDDAAYIFFTSGTTGVPKGVLGSHKGLNHFLNWQRETFGITPEDRVAHLTSLSFDPVLREIFLPLTSGATLCLPEDIDILAANDVLSWLDRERVSVLHTVPSLAQSWLTNTTVKVSLNAMRWVFFAGESLTENLVDRWQSSFPSAEIVNLYGPAETTLAKCFYQLSSGVHHGVQPLGRPLPQTQALVLSRDNQLCSIGEAGEIVLRTPFRSLGYINNHEENRKRFVKNPFRDDEKDQLYYTGDRGRYRPDGMVEFLGRLDDQVKIRGVRVEPKEVTVTLARHPEVDSCFVTNKRDEQRQPRLVAYVVIKGQSTTTVTELRAYLKKQLPATMVPETFVFLADLPLTTRGKVDRRALPGPDLERYRLETKFVAPRTPVEKVLAKIWGEVLGLERVGIHDNFFDLGGHSLLATGVVSRIQQKYNVDLKLIAFFKRPTIAELAKRLEGLLWINAGRPGDDESELQDREDWVL